MIERHLRRALRRKEPPAGFVERVLTRIAADRRAASDRVAERPAAPARWLVAAAAALLVMLGAAQYRVHQQARQQAAKAQVMTAFEIASEKLQMVRQIVGGHN